MNQITLQQAIICSKWTKIIADTLHERIIYRYVVIFKNQK